MEVELTELQLAAHVGQSIFPLISNFLKNLQTFIRLNCAEEKVVLFWL